MNDLQFQATRAVAQRPPDGPGGKIPTIALLRDMDRRRHTLREYIDAVDWAMSRPHPVLTRADKERAVDAMERRLSAAACDYERHRVAVDAEDYARTLRRRHAALLRLAMARTVD